MHGPMWFVILHRDHRAMHAFLEQEYFNNTVEDYLIAFGIIVLGALVIRVFRKIILTQLRRWSTKTETQLDDILVHGLERFMLPIFNFILIYVSLGYLTLSARVEKVVHYAAAVVVTYYAVRLVTSTLRLMLQSYVQKQEVGGEKVKQVRGITLVINLVTWSLGLILLFNNLGYNVTAIITGLGVGGIAVALAAQNILGDLFNYFVIFFDRPFEIGDFVSVDDKTGVVEHIGIKTTRLKTLRGEQLVISNSDFTKSRLHNFAHMQRRRVIMNFGITYETPIALLREIPVIIRQIVEDAPDATFDRAHFATFGTFCLNYEVVFFIESADYNLFMDRQQEINLRTMEVFAQRGIAFAYPTQTVFLHDHTRSVEKVNG